MKKTLRNLVSLILVFVCLFATATASADVDITCYPSYPLQVTDLRIKHTNQHTNGNDVFFEVKFFGGEGPYRCIFYLYGENDTLIDWTIVGPCDTDGFGWSRTFSPDETDWYALYAVVEDANNNRADRWNGLWYIDASPVLYLN